MKKTILMACLLGCITVANAANVIQTATSGKVTLDVTKFNDASSFAVSYKMSGLDISDVSNAYGYVFHFSLTDENYMNPMYRVYYDSDEKWSIKLQGGIASGSVVADEAMPWDGSGTFVFQYQETNNVAEVSFSKLLDDGSDFKTLISGELPVYDDGLAKIVEGNIIIVEPSKGTISDVQVWSGVVEASNLAVSSTVPEPTTVTLSLLALAGLAARRRRK